MNQELDLVSVICINLNVCYALLWNINKILGTSNDVIVIASTFTHNIFLFSRITIICKNVSNLYL